VPQTQTHDITVAVHVVDPATAEVLQIGVDGLLLVRPDGRPVARWATSTDASSISATIAEAVRGTTRLALARAA
jgi:hypothetical protein